MSNATQQQSRSQQQPGQAASPAVQKALETAVTFKPFQSDQVLELTPNQVINYLAAPTKKGNLCSLRDAVKFCMLCKARGLNPWEGDAFIVGYDNDDGTSSFSLITAHQAFLKRSEIHPEYDGMESGIIVRVKVSEDPEKWETIDRLGCVIEPGDTLFGGWATIHFKSRKYPMKKRVAFSVYNTGYSRWKKDPAGMIVKCAEAAALRGAMPNQLGGMYLADEMPETEEVEVQRFVAATPSRPAELPEGRTSVASNGRRQSHEDESTTGSSDSSREPRSDQPGGAPPRRTEEAIDRSGLQDDLDEIRSLIADAKTTDQLGIAAGEIGARAQVLGDDNCTMLSRELEDRRKVLTAGAGAETAGKKGKRMF